MKTIPSVALSIILFLSCYNYGHAAIEPLCSNGGYCTGDSLSFQCTTTNTLRWRVDDTVGGNIVNQLFDTDSTINAPAVVNSFTITLLAVNGPQLIGNITFDFISEYDGYMISCGGESCIINLAVDPPDLPTSVSATPDTYNSATISWVPPNNNGGPSITGYNITISPPPSVSCSTGTCNVSGDTLQYTFTGLDHTQEYSISIAAINCAGTGNATQLQPNLDIDATVPNPPRGPITASLVNSINDRIFLTVSWEEPLPLALSPPVTNYTATVTAAIDGAIFISANTSTNIDVAIGNGEYTVMVAANNDVGPSTGSISLSINLLSCSSSSSASSITIICSSTLISVRYSIMLGGNIMESDIGVAITFPNLESNTAYTYTAMLVGVSNYSVEGNETTLEESDITAPSSVPTNTSSIMPTTTSSSVTSTITRVTLTPSASPIPDGTSSNTALYAGIGGGVGGAIVAILIIIVILAVCIYCYKKPRSKGEDGLTLSEYKPKRDDPEAYIERDPVPETGQSGPMYQDPSTIERQQAPTGDFYALPDKRSTGSRRQPPAAPTELATYQDPSTIQHEAAPTGDLYAMPDKKPAGIAKQDDRTYAALEFENGTGSASTSFQGKPRQPDVLYSEVQPQS